MNDITKSLNERPLLVTFLLGCGAVGPWLFIAAFLVEGATRPGYSAWHNVVSSLASGPLGWTQIVNVIVCGVLLLAFALGLRWALRPGKGSTWGPLLIGLLGLSLAGSGVFVTDPLLGYPPGAPAAHTVHGAIHVLLSFVTFASLIGACFVLSRRFADDPRWRSWELYSVVTGILVGGFFISSDLASTPNRTAPAGLFQRLAFVVGWVWLALLASRLIRVGPPAERPAHELRIRGHKA